MGEIDLGITWVQFVSANEIDQINLAVFASGNCLFLCKCPLAMGYVW